jgi:NAD(P) transhydrogenase subunit alpha
MIVAVPRETSAGERRVALVPTAAAHLAQIGHAVQVESGAGTEAGFSDRDFAEAGVTVIADRDALLSAAQVIVQVRVQGADLRSTREGQIVIGLADPLDPGDELRALAQRGVTLLAMELMPRITRAQEMDVLSSQASLAGYKAVIRAADLLPKIFPLMMTAAGTIRPAKVFIIGAGVAGLQAIATAKRLGAIVHAFDVRPAVKEQVESLGARFVELPISAQEQKGGYAAAQSEEQLRRQQELMARVVAESDIVITTAQIPGKRAPTLVTRAMVHAMQRGSVIVDLAAEHGGNCELTEPGRTITLEGGVTIVGEVNLISGVAHHASQMYASNVARFLHHLTKDGIVQIDPADEITRETLVAHGGEIVHGRVRELLGLPPLDASARDAVQAAERNG